MSEHDIADQLQAEVECQAEALGKADAVIEHLQAELERMRSFRQECTKHEPQPRRQRRDYLIKLLGRGLAILWLAFFLWISALAVTTIWIWIFYD